MELSALSVSNDTESIKIPSIQSTKNIVSYFLLFSAYIIYMVNKRESVEIASRRFPIRNRAERIFRVFLGKVFPDANIAYEPESFSATIYRWEKHPTIPDFALSPMMGTATTRPDFRIIKSNGKKIYIEITKDRKNETDPKQDDKEIMKKAAPDCRYVVLYGDTLLRIQKKSGGEFNFFKKEKKKEPQPGPSKNKPTKDRPKKFTIRSRVEMGNRRTVFPNYNKR